MKHIPLLRAAAAVLTSITLMTACAPSRNKELKEINAMEGKLGETELVADSAAGSKMIERYLRFVEHFPEDTLSPIFLYKASDLSLNMGRYEQSVRCLRQIVDNYPDFREASTCYFLIGNAYEESEKYDSAVMAYNEFLELYPDHPLAEGARFAIGSIGQPLELVLQDMLAGNQGDSLAQDSKATVK